MRLKLDYSLDSIIGDTIKPDVNRTNYYNYSKIEIKSNMSINWLRVNEVIPIIYEELDSMKITYIKDYKYSMPDSSQITLVAYFPEYNIGLVHNYAFHAAEINVKQRKIREYEQIIFDNSGKFVNSKYYKFLPNNIIVLQETWYWYEFSINPDDKFIVDKNKIIDILRSDVNFFITDLILKSKSVKK